MRVLIFDPFHGAAGDMIIGALLGCGADQEIVTKAMQSVVATPTISCVHRAGISAIRVETHAPVVHRTFSDVMTRLEAARDVIPPEALFWARNVFERIRRAEEQVHGQHVHFHEVGADDAIADVIGACTALHTLHVEGVVIHPLAVGSGTVSSSHGTVPIPAPATVALLADSGLSTIMGTDEGELCTPTGAALLAEFSTMKPPAFLHSTILAAGYGAGTRNPSHTPNVLRAMVVETTSDQPSELADDFVDVLETNTDDISGEVVAHAIAGFMDNGARDASANPIIMKKGRPGFLIRVICLPDTSTQMAELMARELGTLGIRCIPSVHRFIADRTVEKVDVEIAGHKRSMPVKCGWMHGSVYTLKAEFDPARDFAAELDMPVRDVIRAIEDAGWKTCRAGRNQRGTP
ncbi:MAG: nickel pincer cofactor biosynthesis protein LarC [Methanoregula sp.]